MCEKCSHLKLETMIPDTKEEVHMEVPLNDTLCRSHYPQRGDSLCTEFSELWNLSKIGTTSEGTDTSADQIFFYHHAGEGIVTKILTNKTMCHLNMPQNYWLRS